MRLPPIFPSNLSPEQRSLHDAMGASVSTKYDRFITTRTHGHYFPVSMTLNGFAVPLPATEDAP